LRIKEKKRIKGKIIIKIIKENNNIKLEKYNNKIIE